MVTEVVANVLTVSVDMSTAGYFRNVSNIDLNAVRLCFQVFLPDANKKFTHIVQPVVSQPIIDKSLFI